MTIAVATFLVGLLVGWLAQRSRMCFIGGFRDYLLVRDKALIKGAVAFFLSAWLTLRLATWIWPELHLSTYPSINSGFLAGVFPWVSLAGGFGLGLFTTLSDACPLRHHVLAGQGRGDSWWFILGLAAGIAVYQTWIAIF